jgi:three-Cys-motif partner protein
MTENIATGDYLFDMEPWTAVETGPAEVPVSNSQYPVWTDNKARFIMCYLRYFVLLTKHGTYIDGFAGPQGECETDSWAAKLVLASEPKWIKHIHLCDAKKAQITRLEELKASQPLYDSKNRKLYRKIHIYPGDFNDKVDEILKSGKISQKQATFCLLDQRTFECRWETLQKLAAYKTTGHKIELFYFLANGWLERALAAQKDTAVIERWWGNRDWVNLKAMSRDERKDALVQRFKKELGYKSARAWPIYERADGGATMYYMLHATDHPEAPKFMSRAYRRHVFPMEPIEQIKLDLFPDSKTAGSLLIQPADTKISA